MAWWAWAVVGWCAASLVAALLLGMTSAEVSRRERRDRARQLSVPFPWGHTALTDPAVLVRLGAETTAVAALRARRHVPGSRPGAGGPPARPVRSRVRTSRPAASLRRHRLARRPGGATPPATGRPSREPRRPLAQHRGAARPAPAPTRDELAQRRRLRAIPSLDCSTVVVVVATAPRRVRTPPVPRSRLPRPTGRRGQRLLLLSCVPVLALAPLLASSTSSLGMHEALAAELAANPDQAAQLIAALDRGRVMAGLTTPVTVPGAPTPPAAPAPADGEPAPTSPSVGPSAPATPSGSATPTAPAPAGQPTRSTAPQPTAGQTRPQAPVTSAPSTPVPPSEGGQVVPVPSTPAVPEPTPSPTPTPTPTPSPVEPTPTPTPSPVEPTPTPTPSPTEPTPVEPTPTDPTPTDPGPVDPEPTDPAPTAGADGDGSADPSGVPLEDG